MTLRLGSRFLDGDADFDAHRRRVRGVDAETEAGAVRDAGRHREPQRMMHQAMARPAAGSAGFGPCLAAAAADLTRAAQRHLERQHDAARCITC